MAAKKWLKDGTAWLETMELDLRLETMTEDIPW